jgi:hypothetical protein
MAECSDHARNLAAAHLVRRAGQTVEIAARFVVPQRQLQPERDGLGVNAVGASVSRFSPASYQVHTTSWRPNGRAWREEDGHGWTWMRKIGRVLILAGNQ